MKNPAVMIVALGLNETNEELIDHMRRMKMSRELRMVDNIGCCISGFGEDPRELGEIPEVIAFCRRLVNQGFISYLDFSTTADVVKENGMSLAWGALEVWLCSIRKMSKHVEITKYHLDKFEKVLGKSNEKADSVCGKFDG